MHIGRKNQTRTVPKNGKTGALRPMCTPRRVTTLTAWQSR